ncbi:hypothetical protein [Maribacter litoralis]|uniref:hypothetical protein n=1 Tax=Maribacter litoralis TaxID=2059726 RepID=UPI003F5CD1C8
MVNNKNKLLLLGIGVLLIASYHLAIKKTFQSRTELKALENESKIYYNIPNKLNLLSQKNNYFDSILAKMDFNDTSIQNNLIRTINQESNKYNIKVMDFNQPHIFPNSSSTEYTYNFNLEGDFTDILKVLYGLEIKGNFGDIIHLNFEKKKDYKTSKNHLTVNVLLQQLK